MNQDMTPARPEGETERARQMLGSREFKVIGANERGSLLECEQCHAVVSASDIGGHSCPTPPSGEREATCPTCGSYGVIMGAGSTAVICPRCGEYTNTLPTPPSRERGEDHELVGHYGAAVAADCGGWGESTAVTQARQALLARLAALTARVAELARVLYEARVDRRMAQRWDRESDIIRNAWLELAREAIKRGVTLSAPAVAPSPTPLQAAAKAVKAEFWKCNNNTDWVPGEAEGFARVALASVLKPQTIGVRCSAHRIRSSAYGEIAHLRIVDDVIDEWPSWGNG